MLESLAALRAAMKEENIQAYIIPTSDFHDTEYVCDYFAARKHFSGFTGSDGTLVVLPDKAGLWTDGRYFIQAAHELKGTGIDLMKLGQPDTPTIEDYIVDNLKAGDTAAFDGRCVSYNNYETWKKAFEKKGIHTEVFKDLTAEVWKDRPAMPAAPTFHLDEKYAGKSVEDKLKEVREKMEENNAEAYLTNKIDDTAWLFNIRAKDIPGFPAPLSYVILTKDGGTFYINDERLDDVSRKILEDNNIAIAPYDQIYEDVKELKVPVLVDGKLVNSTLVCSLENPVLAKDPVQLMKAMKNPVEVEGFRQAHIKDGAAVVKFWNWLEKAMKNGETLTEISAADKLQSFRKEQPDYIEDSFDAISAYGPNAAMCHYHADESNPVVIEPKGLYLVDSGGHYLQGTTDITRTFVVGDLSDEERYAFTRVLQSHIDLAKAKFRYGSGGLSLDVLARQWFWNEGLDFDHGTGHGVGHLLNVHEGPNSFRWKIVPGKTEMSVLEEGMVTSDEPGLYIEDKFGIRHENLLVCKEWKTNEYGKFMEHETLTLVPFDVRGLDVSLMEQDQIDWLNDYHQRVREVITPLLNEEEAAFLEEKTRPVSK